MFLGRYKTFFSGKNRIILPRKFRLELGQEIVFYLVSGVDGEIWGFRNAEWQLEVQRRLNTPITSAEGRKERRLFFGRAEECELDNQGRFIISQNLVTYAGLREEILLIGCGDHFEIWDAERYRE